MRKRSKTEAHPDTGDAAARRPGETALAKAVGLLSRREHSALELRRKLLQRGFDETEVERALAHLAERGLQDDERFAQSLGRIRANGGHGPHRLRAELAQHGLRAEQVASALDASGDPEAWRQRALALAEKRCPRGVRDLREQRRLADFLARRGFGAEDVRAVLSALSARHEQGPEFE